VADERIAGKYRVIRSLGESDYSKVFLAEHAESGTRYALKLLKEITRAVDTCAEDFRQAAQTIQRFQHPGLVQLRDFGRTADGLYYLASDFWEGVTLEELIAKYGRFQVGQALDIMIQILDVLSAVHQGGIVHRHLKPANILALASPSGTLSIKILDLASAQLQDLLSRGSTPGTKNRAPFLGSPAYMSPEQCLGENNIDQRSDLYSAGIIMYELISGDVPFSSDNAVQTLLKHLTQPPPPLAADLRIPDYIRQIICKSLEKDRGRRFQQASDFGAACRRALEQLQSRPATPDKQKQTSVDFPCSTAKDTNTHSKVKQIPAKKILCLDDNQMILRILRNVFEHQGYRVFTATTFAVIHDIIFLEQVPVMLCDVRLPGLQGDKVCRLLKQAMPKLKIILFSSIGEQELVKLAAKCQADGWLCKNAKPSEWVAKVEALKAF